MATAEPVARKRVDAWAFNYQIYLVDEQSNIIDVLGLAQGFRMGVAAVEQAAQQHTSSILELRQKGRILRRIRTGLCDHETKTVEILEVTGGP